MANEGSGGFFTLLRTGNVRALMSRHGDLLVAALVISIVAMMIVPLPTVLLDLLITLNITIAVVLLMVAIYVGEATRIASFPTILLITTLFRLGLNVSSTRLILLQADAGQVIRAFGNFVVRGNFVVGVIVFIILTLIQYIVISKGSERVAEVAARFTLDAMPGKQMAIDADVRAGAYDAAEARRRRAALSRESQLYGAMDGAMKFVKGDAIASILIAIINIVGGLVVGITQRGMTAGESLETYALLTIGDGLVSQIPALLISVAAGLIVTRVASEDEAGGGHVGRDIAEQILAYPKALAIAAVLLGGLAMVPGLPGVPFLVLAVVTGGVAWAVLRKSSEAEKDNRRPETGDRRPETGGTVPQVGVALVAVEMAGDVAGRVGVGDGGRFLVERVAAVRDGLFEELGVVVPGVRVRVAGMAAGTYRILVGDVPMADGVAAGEDAGEVVAEHVRRVVKKHAAELVGIQEAQALLDSLERTHPALVREVVPKLAPLPLVADVLRRLVDEGVSIRDLRLILGALAEWAPTEKDPVLLTEHVRMALRRQITFAFAAGAPSLSVVLLDPEIEDAVKGAVQRTAAGSYLALEPSVSHDILAAVKKQLGELPPSQRPVILTAMELRRFVKRLVESEHPDVAVLSFQELSPDLQILPVGRIAVS